MKKVTRFLVVALSLALLLGAVIGISASAADGGSDGSWVISKNVSYSENIHLMLAIDATEVEDQSKLAVKITDAAGNVSEEMFSTTLVEDLYGESDDGAVAAYVVRTLGVAAKDMADVLTIEVIYDTKVVETTTYSVAEYFFQRLYADEIILATEEKEVNQKNLYLSSLKYGNAAQKLLAASDALYLEDAIYVKSDINGIPAIFDSREILALPNGFYSVKSYVDGKVVNSVVEGGDYIIKNSAIISLFGKTVPDDIVSYDDATVGPITIAISTNNSSGASGSNGISSVSVYSENPANFNAAIENNGTDKYLVGNKTVAASSHAIDIFRNVKDSDVDGKILVFQNRIKYTSTNSKDIYHRIYTGRTKWNGTRLTNLSIKGNGTNVTYNGATTGISVGDWFLLRSVIYKNDNGTFSYEVYVSPDSSVFKKMASGSISGISSLKDISGETFMFSTGIIGSLAVDYSYAGIVDSVNDVPPSVALTSVPGQVESNTGDSATGQASYAVLTTDVNGNGAYDSSKGDVREKTVAVSDEDGNPIPSWKGNIIKVKDILTNTTITTLDDLKGGSDYGSGACSEVHARTLDVGQAIVRYPMAEKSTSHTISVTADLKLDYNSEGNLSAAGTNTTTFRLQTQHDNGNGSATWGSSGSSDAMYIYWNANSSNTVCFVAEKETFVTTVKIGESFSIKYQYTYTPAVEADEANGIEAQAASATATIWVTDARGVTQQFDGVKPHKILDPTYGQTRASVVPNKPFIGSFSSSNVVFGN